jgi:hypothetical protein
MAGETQSSHLLKVNELLVLSKNSRYTLWAVRSKIKIAKKKV